jgi:DNA-binding IclR family transcriptional regulator
VRLQGYATNSSESEDGVSSVGVAVIHPVRGPVATLSVAARSAACARETAAHLKDAAQRLSQLLP